MGVYKGAYSKDDKECNTGVGLDRDSYYPGSRPNKYSSNCSGKPLGTDNDYSRSQWDANQRGKGGFSGRAPRG